MITPLCTPFTRLDCSPFLATPNTYNSQQQHQQQEHEVLSGYTCKSVAILVT